MAIDVNADDRASGEEPPFALRADMAAGVDATRPAVRVQAERAELVPEAPGNKVLRSSRRRWFLADGGVLHAEQQCDHSRAPDQASSWRSQSLAVGRLRRRRPIEAATGAGRRALSVEEDHTHPAVALGVVERPTELRHPCPIKTTLTSLARAEALVTVDRDTPGSWAAVFEWDDVAHGVLGSAG